MNEYNAVWWYLDRHLDGAQADATCLISDGDTRTYRELHDLTCRMARVLTEAPIIAGDRVIIVLHDGVVAFAAILAAMRIGAVPVPLSPALSMTEQEYVVHASGARGIVVEDIDGELSGMFLQRDCGVEAWSAGILLDKAAAADPLPVAVPRNPADAALIQYTSGSTGKPKGVVHQHRGLLAFPDGLGRQLGITPDDRCLSTAKLSFGYGFGNSLMLPLSAGASTVLYPGRSEPHAIAGLLRRTRPTILFSVPTLYAALLSMPAAAEHLDFSSVRLAVSAGEHLGVALSTKLAENFGLNVVNGLGSTECLHIFLATRPGISPPGSTGEPVMGFDVEVRDDADRVLSAGVPGHLHVRGPCVASGYLDSPEQTAHTFRDGWVRTGDVMLRDAASGWIYIGRSDDILNVGGMKIAPAEIEDCIQRDPGVSSCAVIGLPDEDDITRIVAYVVPQPGVGDELTARLLAALRKTLPPFKRPQVIRLVSQLPTTSTGKIARFAIRRHELEGRTCDKTSG